VAIQIPKWIFFTPKIWGRFKMVVVVSIWGKMNPIGLAHFSNMG